MSFLGPILAGLAAEFAPKLLNVIGDVGKSIVEGKPFLPALGTSLEKNILGINVAKQKALPIPTDLLIDRRPASKISQILTQVAPLVPLIKKALPIIRPIITQLLPTRGGRAPAIRERVAQRPPFLATQQKRRRRRRKRKRKKKKKRKNLPAKRRISRAI